MRVQSMQKTTLMTKIYGRKQRTFQEFKDEIVSALEDLNVTVSSFMLQEGGFVTVSLTGEDEVVATNYLVSLYGKMYDLKEIKEGLNVRGYICSSGKVGFGVFVDIGIKSPYEIDALLPLYNLRKQLVNDKKIPTREIIDNFGLVDNFPLEITIEEVSIGLKKIKAKFSDGQMEKFNHWIDEGLERLIIIGAFKEEIERVLEKTNHTHDIIEIENLGWMENALSCKFNTSAKGLIPELGRVLPKARFEIFSPSKIKKLLRK